jgi:hypothetical protein
MPLSLEDINDAMVQGEANFLNYMRQFEEEFMAATEMKQAKIVWNSLPGEIKETMKKMDPVAYAEAEKLIERSGG